MIIRASSNTKRITLRVRRNNAQDCCDKMELRITPLQCEEPPKYKYCYTECGGMERVEIKREPLFTLVYDMFDYDERGNVNFLLDSQFANLPCGRYNAELCVCGCKVSKFQIDKRDIVKVSDVMVDDRNDCCEGKYGC